VTIWALPQEDRAEVTEEEQVDKIPTEEPARTAIKTGGLVTSTSQVNLDSTEPRNGDDQALPKRTVPRSLKRN